VEQGKASCKHGMLTIRFPKRADQGKVRQIPISAESGEAQPRDQDKTKEKAA
jgi:hypothetical protein